MIASDKLEKFYEMHKQDKKEACKYYYFHEMYNNYIALEAAFEVDKKTGDVLIGEKKKYLKIDMKSHEYFIEETLTILYIFNLKKGYEKFICVDSPHNIFNLLSTLARLSNKHELYEHIEEIEFLVEIGILARDHAFQLKITEAYKAVLFKFLSETNTRMSEVIKNRLFSEKEIIKYFFGISLNEFRKMSFRVLHAMHAKVGVVSNLVKYSLAYKEKMGLGRLSQEQIDEASKPSLTKPDIVFQFSKLLSSIYRNKEFIKNIRDLDNRHEQSLWADTIKMGKQLMEITDLRWSDKRMIQEHDRRSKEITIKKLAQEDRPLKVYEVFRKFYKYTKERDYKDLELIDTLYEISYEGARQSNCVASYVSRVENAECAIFRYQKKYTCEIKFANDKFYLNQMRAIRNSEPPLKDREDMKHILNEVNGDSKFMEDIIEYHGANSPSSGIKGYNPRVEWNRENVEMIRDIPAFNYTAEVEAELNYWRQINEGTIQNTEAYPIQIQNNPDYQYVNNQINRMFGLNEDDMG